MSREKVIHDIAKVINREADKIKVERVKRYKRPWYLRLLDAIFPFAQLTNRALNWHRAKYNAQTDAIIKTATKRAIADMRKAKRGRAKPKEAAHA